jgi:hypothetical protein
VDLYVLERALESTHIQEGLMDKVIVGYNESKRAASTLAKLADVRMRGRKRVMVGWSEVMVIFSLPPREAGPVKLGVRTEWAWVRCHG